MGVMLKEDIKNNLSQIISVLITATVTVIIIVGPYILGVKMEWVLLFYLLTIVVFSAAIMIIVVLYIGGIKERRNMQEKLQNLKNKTKQKCNDKHLKRVKQLTMMNEKKKVKDIYGTLINYIPEPYKTQLWEAFELPRDLSKITFNDVIHDIYYHKLPDHDNTKKDVKNIEKIVRIHNKIMAILDKETKGTWSLKKTNDLFNNEIKDEINKMCDIINSEYERINEGPKKEKN